MHYEAVAGCRQLQESINRLALHIDAHQILVNRRAVPIKLACADSSRCLTVVVVSIVGGLGAGASGGSWCEECLGTLGRGRTRSSHVIRCTATATTVILRQTAPGVTDHALSVRLPRRFYFCLVVEAGQEADGVGLYLQLMIPTGLFLIRRWLPLVDVACCASNEPQRLLVRYFFVVARGWQLIQVDGVGGGCRGAKLNVLFGGRDEHALSGRLLNWFFVWQSHGNSLVIPGFDLLGFGHPQLLYFLVFLISASIPSFPRNSCLQGSIPTLLRTADTLPVRREDLLTVSLRDAIGFG